MQRALRYYLRKIICEAKRDKHAVRADMQLYRDIKAKFREAYTYMAGIDGKQLACSLGPAMAEVSTAPVLFNGVSFCKTFIYSGFPAGQLDRLSEDDIVLYGQIRDSYDTIFVLPIEKVHSLLAIADSLKQFIILLERAGEKRRLNNIDDELF